MVRAKGIRKTKKAKHIADNFWGLNFILDNRFARAMMSPSFANSEGWKLIPPNDTHLLIDPDENNRGIARRTTVRKYMIYPNAQKVLKCII